MLCWLFALLFFSISRDIVNGALVQFPNQTFDSATLVLNVFVFCNAFFCMYYISLVFNVLLSFKNACALGLTFEV